MLTDLLTAGLSSDARWKLIERTALRELEQELALSAGGWADSVTAVRQGRLAHADVVLVCRLRASGDASGEAEIEAIDAFRADRLGHVRIPLSTRPNGPWLRSPPAADTAAIIVATEKLLAVALARLEQMRGRPVIAPLFVHNTGVSQRVNPLGVRFLEALETAAGTEGARMLRVQASDAVHNEGLLCNMGISEFSAESWAQVADVFLWAEFAEGESAGMSSGEVPVQLRVWAWSGAGEPRAVELKGTLGQLDALASEGARVVMGKLTRRERPSPEARGQVAKLLLTEAASIGLPDLRSGVSIGRADEVRRIGVMRMVDAAAFFVPEDPVVQELRLQLLDRAGAGASSEGGLRLQRAKLIREFMRRPDGSIDLGLVKRLLRQPYGQEGLELIGELGKALRDVPATELQPWRELFEVILNGLYMDRGNAAVPPALEAVWPAMLAAMPDALDPKLVRQTMGARYYIGEIFRNDSERGNALLEGRLKDASPAGALPAVHLYKSVGPSLAQWAPAPAPHPIPADRSDTVNHPRPRSPLRPLQCGPQRVLKNEGNNFLLDRLPELHPALAAFSIQQVSAEAPATPLYQQVIAAVAEPQALWVITEDLAPRDSSFPDARTSNFWRFDPVQQTAVRLTNRLGTRAGLTSLAFGAGRVWIGTRGEGLRVYDPAKDQARAFTSAAGLPLDDIGRLLVDGPDLYLEGGAAGAPVVYRWRESSGEALRMKLLSGGTLPVPAMMGAVFGPADTVATCALGELPASAWGQIDDSQRAMRIAFPKMPEPEPVACPRSIDRGYWLGSDALLERVSDGQVHLVAALAGGTVHGVADDGRFLYVQVQHCFDDRLRSLDWSDAGSPRQRVFVFDHRESRWIGWFATPPAAGMTAAPGTLWLLTNRLLPVVAINTSAWSPPIVASAPSATGDLFSLIAQHKTEAVGLALRGGTGINRATPSGWTPLHAAVWAGDAEMVRLVLEAGARSDATDRRGWHPLQMAAAQGDLAVVELLLQKGAAVNFAGVARPWVPVNNPFQGTVRAIDRRTALHAAAAEGNLAVVVRLLKAGADWRLQDGGGQTPLHLAVENIAIDGCKALLAGGADPGVANAEGVSAAEQANHVPELQEVLAAVPMSVDRLSEQLRNVCGKSERLDEVRKLVEAGADSSAGGDKRWPALLVAMEFGHWDYVSAMVAHPGDLSRMMSLLPDKPVSVGAMALCLALDDKRLEIARALLAAGARPVNDRPLPLKGGSSHSLLYLAVVAGDPDLLKQLISLGARPGVKDGSLLAAVVSKNAAVLRLLVSFYPSGDGLLKHGPIDDPAGNGRVALVQAVLEGWREGVEILVTAGASTEVTDHDGRNLQELAGGDAEINLLLNRRPGAPDNQRAGAEAVAAIGCNDPRLGTWPLDAAVLQYRDSRNWTVLHHACAKERDTFARRLIAAGAPVNVLSTGGMTPLAFVAGRSEPLITVLLQAGADVNLAGDRGVTPLHRAAGAASLGTVKLLLAAGADWRRQAFWYGESPLLTVAKQPGAMTVVQALLDAGAPVLTCDTAGLGVLEYATRSNDAAMIQFFLDRGARWRTAGAGNENHPLLIAVQGGATESVRKILELGLYDERALALATDPAIRGMLEDASHRKGLRVVDDEELWPTICSDAGHGTERAAAHVARGGNINYASAEWTPLVLALQAGNPALVRWLLEHKADPHLRPLRFESVNLFNQILCYVRGEMTPQEIERQDGIYAELSQILLGAGVKPDGLSELVDAAFAGRKKTVAVFLAAGVSREAAVRKIAQDTFYGPEGRASALRLLDQ